MNDALHVNLRLPFVVIRAALLGKAEAANFSGPVISVLDGDAKKGLWTDPQPVPPWEWRKRTRSGTQWLRDAWHNYPG